MRWIVLSLGLLASADASAEGVYRCKGDDGITNYVRKPTGNDCVLIGQFTADPEKDILRGPPSILGICQDPDANGSRAYLQGPSARARECTRMMCGKPAYQQKVQLYAMRQKQPAPAEIDALTCITRKEQDMRAR